jgi:hypothetical protein
MLQTAVHDAAELRSVKNKCDQHKTRTGIDLTLSEHMSLVESATVSCNSNNKKGPPKISKRLVCFHEDVTQEEDDPCDFNVDTFPSETLAFVCQGQ